MSNARAPPCLLSVLGVDWTVDAHPNERTAGLLAHGTMAYREMTESRLGGYLASLPEIAARLGSRPALWQIRQVGHGDLSAVFVVEGPAGALCVKQALPSTQDLDRRTRLSLERTGFEQAALTLYTRFVPDRVPRVLHYDSELALMILERLDRHVVLREGLIAGKVYPRFAEQIAQFLAETLFRTSDLALPAGEKKERVAFFYANDEVCRLTEYLTFTEPYMAAGRNRWTSPQLDDLAREVQADDALKRAVSRLKLRFLAQPQALLHGNLHTSSVMVTETDTKVIDPAFAVFGPIGFDLGSLIGHLLLSWFSQSGHAPPGAPRAACERWLAEAVGELWQGFHDRFLGLWQSAHRGDAYPEALFAGASGAASLREAQREHMRTLFEDTLRFAGAAIIRATLGRDHVRDFEQIEDRGRRAAAERPALQLARELLKDAQYVSDLGEVMEVARQLRAGAAAAA
jgi:5-methylthioribose kinase